MTHSRREPLRHAFTHRHFQWLVDVDDLPGIGRNDAFGTSSFGVDGRVHYSVASGRIFRLDGEGRSWEAVGAWSLPRITHRRLPGPGRSLLAVGGNAKGKLTPVIEAVVLRSLLRTAPGRPPRRDAAPARRTPRAAGP